jgi:hypothetical protein
MNLIVCDHRATNRPCHTVWQPQKRLRTIRGVVESQVAADRSGGSEFPGRSFVLLIEHAWVVRPRLNA